MFIYFYFSTHAMFSQELCLQISSPSSMVHEVRRSTIFRLAQLVLLLLIVFLRTYQVSCICTRRKYMSVCMEKSGSFLHLNQGIPRDTFSSPGRYPAGLICPGRLSGRVPFVWNVASAGRACAGSGFTLFRGAGAGYSNLCGTRLCGHEISYSSLDRGISGWPRLMRGASNAFTHLTRNVTQSRPSWGFVGRCSCPQVKANVQLGAALSLFLCGTCLCGSGIL